MAYQSTEIDKILYLVSDNTDQRLVLKKINGAFVLVDLDSPASRDAAISAAVNALLNGAPGALDTLKELADALGDDANFAASVTTALNNRSPILPTVGNFTYDGSGNVLTDPDGNTYTWNADGTVATQTRGGVTRTYNWNSDGTLGSVS